MAFQSLYKDIFNQQTDNKELLKKAAQEYPYFSAAHFFLLQQTGKEENDYAGIAAKAALHFANPYLLNRQLQEDTQEDIPFIPVKAAEPVAETSAENHTTMIHEPVKEEEQAAATPVADKPTQEDTLLFEPLHTTDYFASQGIKLSEVVQPGDKMGRQLKSFTEWLKTMKKIHPDGLKEKTAADAVIDPSVQALAEKSNKEEEVLTESMAEVYLQQGKTNKAKEIYEKLSLLNPSKNAYFAAKINEIQ